MGLRNYYKDGSYSNITNVSYDKQHRLISFVVTVYKNESKMVSLVSIPFCLNASQQIREVVSVVSELPSTPSVGDVHLVLPNTIGERCKLAEYKADNQWHYIVVGDEFLFYNQDENKYTKVSGQEVIVDEYYFGEREYNQYFSPEALSLENNNILAAIYNVLKSRPDFENVEDVL